MRIRKLVKSLGKKIGILSDAKDKKTIINYRNKGTVNFIDIGSVGVLPDPWRLNAGIIKHVLKFEPRDPAEKVENITTVSAALWECDDVRPFYIYKGFKHTGSSLFQQNYEYVKDNFENLKKRGPVSLAETWFDRSELIREEKLQCKTLRTVLEENKLNEQFHFIKIDAQGAEYEILRGGEPIIQNCLGLHLELFELPLYKGIKLLPDVVSYLNGLGFELVKKFPAHGSFDSQHDCLFLKASSKDERISIIKKVYNL